MYFDFAMVSRKTTNSICKHVLIALFSSCLYLSSKKMGKKVTINVSFGVMDMWQCRYANYQLRSGK